MSIPRLELSAAVLAVKVADIVRKEIEHKIDREFFYTDSSIVLGYLKNQSKHFKLFVANRVSTTLKCSKSNQWFHVESKQNQQTVLLEV